MSCVNDDQNPGLPPDFQRHNLAYQAPTHPRLRVDGPHLSAAQGGVSWGYYVFKGTEPDCEDDAALSCSPVKQGPKTPGIWNPLPYFDTVQQDGQLGNIQSLQNFFAQAKAGTLPAVSWVVPERHRLRASARACQRRPELRHRADQRDHAQPRLEQHRDLPLVG